MKRAAHSTAINLDELPDVQSSRGAELIAIDEALDRLTEFDLRKAKVIELRFFGWSER